jgi:hypothetical protein
MNFFEVFESPIGICKTPAFIRGRLGRPIIRQAELDLRPGPSSLGEGIYVELNG